VSTVEGNAKDSPSTFSILNSSDSMRCARRLDRRGTDTEQAQDCEPLPHRHADSHGVAVDLDNTFVPSARQVVLDSLPRCLWFHDDCAALAKSVFVNSLCSGASGGFGLIERGAPAREHVATVDHQSGDREQRNGKDDDKGRDCPGVTSASASHVRVPR
jgi:hypothetical protein